MPRDYLALDRHPLAADAAVLRPAQRVANRVRVDTPALEVMTDLARVNAVTIEPTATVDQANDYMIRRRVRLLFVVDAEERVIGLVDSADLLGHKPLLAAQQRAVPRRDVVVGDVMTLASDLQVVYYHEVQGAKVGHVLETLRAVGRQHLVVAERDTAGRERVRGIISLSQVARQLGIEVPNTEFARTFAQIEAALAH